MRQKPEFLCQFVETIRKLVSTPIMILLPQKTKERIDIIKAGADVVLEEPCDSEEIRLQAYVLIRRYTELESKERTDDIIKIDSLKINLLKRTLYWNQTEIPVVKREFDFLYLLASTPGRVYTYSQIYRIVW